MGWPQRYFMAIGGKQRFHHISQKTVVSKAVSYINCRHHCTAIFDPDVICWRVLPASIIYYFLSNTIEHHWVHDTVDRWSSCVAWLTWLCTAVAESSSKVTILVQLLTNLKSKKTKAINPEGCLWRHFNFTLKWIKVVQTSLCWKVFGQKHFVLFQMLTVKPSMILTHLETSNV